MAISAKNWPFSAKNWQVSWKPMFLCIKFLLKLVAFLKTYVVIIFLHKNSCTYFESKTHFFRRKYCNNRNIRPACRKANYCLYQIIQQDLIVFSIDLCCRNRSLYWIIGPSAADFIFDFSHESNPTCVLSHWDQCESGARVHAVWPDGRVKKSPKVTPNAFFCQNYYITFSRVSM
jgi:hypothetical protein